MVAAQDAAQTLDGGAAAQMCPPPEILPAPFNAATYDWMGPLFFDLRELDALYDGMARKQDPERWTCFSATIPDHWLDNKLRIQVLSLLAGPAASLTVEWVQAYADRETKILRVECDLYPPETLSGVKPPKVQVVNHACAALGKVAGPHTLVRWWRTADHYARKQALGALHNRLNLDKTPEELRPSTERDLPIERMEVWRRLYVIEVPTPFQSKEARGSILGPVKARFGPKNYKWVAPVYRGGNALVLLDMGEPRALALRVAAILTHSPDRWVPRGHKAADFLNALARADYWYEAHVEVGIVPPDMRGSVQAVVRVVDRLALHEIVDDIVPAPTNADPAAWRVPSIVTRWLYTWWSGTFSVVRGFCPHSFVLAVIIARMAMITGALHRTLTVEQHIARLVIQNSGACEQDPRTQTWERIDVTAFIQWLWETGNDIRLRVPFYPVSRDEAFSYKWNPLRAEYTQQRRALEAAGGAQLLRAVREALVEARYAPKDPSSALYGLSDTLDVEPPEGPYALSMLAESRADAWGIYNGSDLDEEPIAVQGETIAAWTKLLDAYFSNTGMEGENG